MQNARFRRLTDLFVRGKEVALPDGSYLWVQVINAFERDECLSDAQVARARLVMALKDTGDERVKVEGRFAEVGKDRMAQDLADARTEGKMADLIDEMRADEDWKERMEIVLRTDFDEAAKPPTPEETAFLTKVNAEVLEELTRREKDERAFLERSFQRMSDEEIIDEWAEEWMNRRGSALATQEFRLTELWYATRYCDAVVNENGEVDHTRCNGHTERVFPTKAEARQAPTELQNLLRGVLDSLSMEGRDPKDSDSPTSSSDSPPTPSAPEASTPSTSTATPAPLPGT